MDQEKTAAARALGRAPHTCVGATRARTILRKYGPTAHLTRRLTIRLAMTTILVRHNVRDYAKWKAAYDSFDALHKANGALSSQILRGSDDGNQVVVLTEFADVHKAKQFAHSDALKKAMETAGVADHPDIYFLERAATRSFA